MICDVKDEVVILVSEFRVINCHCIELIDFTHTHTIPISSSAFQIESAFIKINQSICHSSIIPGENFKN